MKFNNNKERMEHPQASIIPENICLSSSSFWNSEHPYPYCLDIAGIDFPDEIILFIYAIQNNPKSLISYIRENQATLAIINKRAGLVVAILYAELDGSLMQQIRDLLDLSHELFFNLCAEVGNISLMKVLAQNSLVRRWTQKVIAADYYKIFQQAANHGYLKVLHYLAQEVNENLPEMVIANDYAAFRKAASNGHLEILAYLAEQAPDKLQDMIAANSYEAFHKGARNGHLEVLHYLERQAPDKLQAMIVADNYYAFHITAINGHLDVLRYLLERVPDKQTMIAVYNYKAFCNAAANGYLDVLKYIAEQVPNKIQAMIEANNYDAFQRAAFAGHLSVLNYIEEQAPDKLQAMIIADNYAAFRWAAGNGQLEALDYIARHAVDKLEAMIEAHDYEAFSTAALCGHRSVLEYLAKLAPHRLQDMIKADDYLAFRWAAGNGHLSTLEYLREQAPDKFQDMIEMYDYEAFCEAAGSGSQLTLNYLIEHVPDKLQKMIAAHNYGAFYNAAIHGRQTILEYLAEQAPVMLQAMIEAENYNAFRQTASHGYLSTLKYLVTNAPDKLPAMIAANDYEAFRSAAHYGFKTILEYLAKLAPNDLEDMICAGDYESFRYAASQGHLLVLEYLAEQAPNKLADMIQARNYDAFRSAASLHHHSVVHFLLSKTVAFAYAESHEHEFGYYTSSFIDASVNDLRQKKADYDNETVPITPEEAKHLFYLARALIRRQAPLEILHLILELPAVKALAHQAVTPEQPNELLRLAGRLGNQEICEYLLMIPAVQRDAEANNFYLNEYQGTNLRLIAQDTESSMMGLSKEESDRLDILKNHYLTEAQKSPHQILEELRLLLIKRYVENPESIILTHSRGKTKNLVLPYSWHEFVLLSLSKEEKQRAFEAYYKNKNHTALRFISKPNHWMHPHAPYTNRNTLGQWSAFEDYAELIAVLFLAAKDEDTPGIDGYNLEGRISQFIDELALIGRSHNWDEKNENGYEYDDLQGDKPSCYSGTKRRLFQSVQGHPLLKQLTLDLVQQELREFVWNHFFKVIPSIDQQVLQTIWQKQIDMEQLTHEEEIIIAKTNISNESQTSWFKELFVKYGNQVARYNPFLLRMFSLSDHESHFIRFSYLGLDQLFKNSALEKEDSQGCLDLMREPSSSAAELSPRFFDNKGREQNRRPVYIENLCFPF